MKRRKRYNIKSIFQQFKRIKMEKQDSLNEISEETISEELKLEIKNKILEILIFFLRPYKTQIRKLLRLAGIIEKVKERHA